MINDWQLDKVGKETILTFVSINKETNVSTPNQSQKHIYTHTHTYILAQSKHTYTWGISSWCNG